MIDTVIFDFDGVILDTETPDFQSWQSVFRSHGVELDLARWTRYVGSGSHNFDACGHLEKLTGQGVDRRQVATARRQRYLRQVNSQPLMPGVADRIAEARALGLKLGVASSSSRGWVEGHLHRLGILQMFAAVKTADDVARVKPDPQIYRSVAAALGSLPKQSLAIEDSAHGVNAAKGAGLHCLAVPNSITRHMPLQNADRRFDSLEEVSLADLRAELMQLGDSAVRKQGSGQRPRRD